MDKQLEKELKEKISAAIEKAMADHRLDLDSAPDIHLEAPRDSTHGDYATNLSLRLAKQLKKPPM